MKLFPLFILVIFSFKSALGNEGYIIKLRPKTYERLREEKKIESENILDTSFGKFYFQKNLEKDDYFEDEVEYIVPNDFIEGLTIDDPSFKSQWGLRNTGDNNWFKGAEGTDLNILPAWKKSLGDSNFIIALIDSGVDLENIDLKNNIWKNEKELNGVEGIDDDQNGFVDDFYGYDFVENDGLPFDLNGHGTLNAGIIAAEHNDIGIRGVMAHVSLMPIRFLNEKNHGDTFNAIKSIHYAIENGAKIISSSWGGSPFNKAMYEAIKEAQDKGILFVAAAGNFGKDNDEKPLYPASYDLENIISVAAFNGKGKKAKFSNYGKHSVDIFAPGQYINSTGLDNQERWGSGTSFAVPFISGGLGLFWSYQKSLDFRQIKRLLIETSTRDPQLKELSVGGRANLGKLFLHGK